MPTSVPSLIALIFCVAFPLSGVVAMAFMCSHYHPDKPPPPSLK